MEESPLLLSVRTRRESEPGSGGQVSSSSGSNEASGMTDIHIAARWGNLGAVQACVNNDPTTRDTRTANGETPLIIAALSGRLKVVEWLHKRGASLTDVLPNRNTVVHCAAGSSFPRTLQYILAQEGMKDYIDSLNKDGETPSHIAVRCGSPETLRVLCSHGADLTVRNRYSQTPSDLAQALGHPQCLQVLLQCGYPQPPPQTVTTEEDTDGSLGTSDVASTSPISLQNDQKQVFHREECVETALTVQGNNTSSGHRRAECGSGEKAQSQSTPKPQRETPTPEKSVTGPGATTRQKEWPLGGGGEVPLAPLQPMKQKTFQQGEKARANRGRHAQQDVRGNLGSQLHSTPSRTTHERAQPKGEKARANAAEPGGTTASNSFQTTNSVTPQNICPKCGNRIPARSITVNNPKMMIIGGTIVEQADSVQYDETTCSFCMIEAVRDKLSNHRARGGRERWRSESTGDDDERREGRERRRSAAARERGGSVGSQGRRGSEIDGTRGSGIDGRRGSGIDGRRGSGIDGTRGSGIDGRRGSGIDGRRGSGIDGRRGSGRGYSLPMESTDGHDTEEELSSDDDEITENLESGYSTLPYNSTPPDPRAVPERAEFSRLVEIREHKTPVPDKMAVKHGECVSLYAKVTPKCSQPLKYEWLIMKRGTPDSRVIGKQCKLRYVVTKEMKIFCRVSLKHKHNIMAKSKLVSITPKLVWITSDLTLEGRYLGRRAVLKCTAEKHASVQENIRFLWLKKNLSSQVFWFYQEADSPTLTFDPLSSAHNGYYVCQAEVKGDFAETNAVHVQGCIPPLVEVVKQPRSWVMAEGDRLMLHCQATLRDSGRRRSLSYQWVHDDSPIPGATSSTFTRESVTVEDMGLYRCRVGDGRGGIVISEPATVALAHSGETQCDSGPKSLQQIQQLRAEQIQQTAEGKCYATDKVAFLVGNEAYRHHNRLSSSVADVRALQNALSEAGFKVFSLVNLSYDETMSAFSLICDLLVAGAYVVFSYTGHGCRLGDTDYIIPIDAHHPVNPYQCIASTTISDRLQSKLCRVFLISNCCRTTPQCHFSMPPLQLTCKYANYATLTASMEGQKAFEEPGKASSFTTAFVDALREGEGVSYRILFHQVTEKMKSINVSDGASTYPRPTEGYSPMDSDISLHDDIMLDDPETEEILDRLHQSWRAANTPPGPVQLEPEDLEPGLGKLVESVCLRFDCDLSNVLVVVINWRVVHSQGISCTVDMIDQGQGVDVERSSMQDCEAIFRISSLQRLSGNLRLQFQFSVTSHQHPEHRHFSVSHNLQSRPLFALIT